MAASADPTDVIQLPRLRPGDLATLLVELAATARGLAAALDAHHKAPRKKGAAATVPDDLAELPDAVPARVLEALADMEAARPPLAEALSRPEATDRLTPAQRAMDARMNASWRCVRLTLERGAERAAMGGDEALATRCRDAVKRLFPEGLAFIAFVGRPEYTASETCLGVIDRDLADLFAALPDGAALVRDVRAVHDEYGRAFYITAPAPARSDEGPGVAATTTAAAEAAKEYVAAVLGSVRRADPKTRALAARLLGPIANYGRPASPAAPPRAEPEPPPAPPTPPVDPSGPR